MKKGRGQYSFTSHVNSGSLIDAHYYLNKNNVENHSHECYHKSCATINFDVRKYLVPSYIMN